MGMFEGFSPGEEAPIQKAVRLWTNSSKYTNEYSQYQEEERKKRAAEAAANIAALKAANLGGKTMAEIDAAGKTFTSNVGNLAVTQPTPVSKPNFLGFLSNLQVAPPASKLDFQNHDNDIAGNGFWGKIRTVEDNVGNNLKANPLYNGVANSLPVKVLNRAAYSAANTMTGGGAIGSNPDLGKIGNTATDFLGFGLGMAMRNPGLNGGSINSALSPVGNLAEKGVVKGLNKLGPALPTTVNKVANYALPTAARGAAEFGLYGGANNAVQGKDILQGAGEGALSGALFNVGGKALGSAVKGISKNAVKTNVTESKFNPNNPNNILKPVKNTLKTNVDPITGKLESKGVTAPLTNKLNLQTFADADIKPDNGEVNISRPMELTTGGKRKTSEFYSNSLKETKVIPKEVKSMLDEAEFQYNVKSNEADLERARRNIETKGIKGVVDEHLQNNSDKLTSTQVMENFLITKELASKAKNTGLDSDYRNLLNWTKINRGQYTEAGQAIQAISVYKKSTPEGMLLEAEKQIDGAAKDLKKSNPKKVKKAETEAKETEKQMKEEGRTDGEIEAALDKIYKKYGVPNLTTEDTKFILDTMEKAQGLEGRERDIEIGKVTQLIADNIPATMPEKVRAWQRISMLLNPKTMVRNTLGNVVMGLLENAKDLPATALDKGLGKISGVRTTGLSSLGTQLKAGKEGIKQVREDAKLGIDTSMAKGQYDLPTGRTFNNPILNKLDKMTKHGLQYGDVPFYKAAYEDSLRQQMKLNNVKEPTEDMIKLAKDVAENRTFQNASNIAKGFDGLRKALNNITGTQNFGLGNLVIPFTKTPANILDKAIDYSPAAAIKLAKQCVDIKKEGLNAFNQKKFVDTFGRGVTGTAIIVLGYKLSESGLMNGAANKDADKAAMDKLSGDLPYSFKIGDTSYTFDWAQPSSVPLAIGADVYESGKGKEGLWNTVVSAVQSGGTTLFNQSLFQSLQKLMGGYDPVGGLTKTAQAWPSQFMPTLLKQVGQVADETTRSTYDPSGAQTALNTLESKLPFAAKGLQPKVNVLGEDTKTYDSKGFSRLGDIFLNPGFHSSQLNNKGVDLVKKIYDETGETKQFPTVAKKSFIVDGDKITLTAKEYTEYQRMLGQKTNEYLNSLTDTGKYADMADDIQSKISDINKEAKAKILESRGTLYPSFLKDQITEQIKYNTSDRATSVRKKVEQISSSNRTNEEKSQLLQNLQSSIGGMKQGKAPKKKKESTFNPFDK